MKILIIVLLTIIFSLSFSSAMAAEECKDTINVKVNGMVCDFCARALEKVFGRRDDVAHIKVDLDNSNVIVEMKRGLNIDDAAITKLISDSGYDVKNINRGC